MTSEKFIFQFESGVTFREEEDGEITCGNCGQHCKRILTHLGKKKECSKNLNIGNLKISLNRFMNRRHQRKHTEKLKEIDEDKFKEIQAKRKRKSDENAKKEGEPKFKENQRQRRRKCDENSKIKDEEKFKDNQRQRQSKCDEKAKEKGQETFKNNQKQRRRKCDEKAKEEGEETFKTNKKQRQRKCVENSKIKDEEKFKDNQRQRRSKCDEKAKEKGQETFKNNQKQRRRNCDEKAKEENHEKFKKNQRQRRIRCDEKTKEKSEEKFRENKIRRQRKYDEKARQNAQEKTETCRKNEKHINAKERLRRFKVSVRFGPIFVCSSCHQKLFRHQVQILDKTLEEKLKATHKEIYSQTIPETGKVPIKINVKEKGAYSTEKHYYLCKQCRKYLENGKMPKLSHVNGLAVDYVEMNMRLTELESNLIAKNIIFQKFHKKAKSRWSGMHDRLINVPITNDAIINTVETLPRTPTEAGIVSVKLKRKVEFKGHHLEQTIDSRKIFRFLDFLKKSGHPGYKFYEDFQTYEARCEREDPEGFTLLYPDYEDLHPKYIDPLQEHLPVGPEGMYEVSDQFVEKTITENESPTENEEEEEINNTDNIKKNQFNYDQNTCMSSKFPEAGLQHEFSVAPGEGQIPTSILRDKQWDINSFPQLFPSGNNGMFQERKVPITPQEFIGSRLKNQDTRFEQCSTYVFACAGYLEEKQMERNIGVSWTKGKLVDSQGGHRTYHLEDSFGVLDNVKNTPRYHKKNKMEMLSKLDNYGPFHFFFTLSCADQRWTENFTSILREKNWTIIWDAGDQTLEEKADPNILVRLEDGILLPLNEFLQTVADESTHEYIRTNVFTATRNFIQRANSFKKEIMMGSNNPMNINKYSWKCEFQGRGAGHLHGTAWCHLHKISKDKNKDKISNDKNKDKISNNKNKDKISNDKDKISHVKKEEEDDTEYGEDDRANSTTPLERAFEHLRLGKELSVEEKNSLVQLADKFTTCTLNACKASEHFEEKGDQNEGRKIIEIAYDCQIHHHTKTCSKKGGKCRFHFPRFPMWKTVLTHSVEGESPEDRDKVLAEHEKTLKAVREIIENNEIIESILSNYRLEEESLAEYEENRKERILLLLEHAGVTENEYLAAITESNRKGITVVLQRDINECFVNNYNGEWLRAWSGNMDIQVTLDFFSVITYITEYFCKDDTGTTAFLVEAAKQCSNLPIHQQRRCLKNVFLTHRQMGIFEAFMKIFPHMRMKDGNIGVEYIPLGKPDEISRYLVRADEEKHYHDTELFNIEDREGKYYERPNIVQKYLRRGDGLEELCLTQFAKMYDASGSIKGETIEELEEDKEEEFEQKQKINENEDENKITSQIHEKYGNEAKFHLLIKHNGELGKPLPSYIQLKDPLPNEPAYMKKRGSAKALRFYKAKNDQDSSRFYLHELMLYTSFNKERYIKWCSDGKVCTEEYLKHQDHIQKVKGQVMEWIQNVEEARMHVEEILSNEVDTEETGAAMDAEKEQDILDCVDEGEEDDPMYHHLNPEGFLDNPCPIDNNKLCKQLQLEKTEILETKTQQLDENQRKVVDIAIQFARDTVKASKWPNKSPKAPKLIITGGAGAGKSTVINVLCQWFHKILQQPGDDPDCPYIIKTATTGAASVLIDGITLHSAMGFDFSNKHSSLTDKKRELRREQMKNVKAIIVDEFSMLKPDILYRLDLVLREIKQNNKEFGGCMVFLFGDLLQLKPVRGRFIFQQPSCPEYHQAFGDGTDSLWKSFSVLNLTNNHRQGADRTYAEVLNRIRVGKQTVEDVNILKERIREENHPDLQTNTTRIYSTVKEVVDYNRKKIEELRGSSYIIKATHFTRTNANFKPTIDKAGRVGDTQFLDTLHIKIGSRVMLIYNLSVSDGLANGAIGELVGVETNKAGMVDKMFIKFDNDSIGTDTRKAYPTFSTKYPGATVIFRKEIEYSLARTNSLVSSTAKLVQFPLIPAFAVTSHRFQGQTIKWPSKVVIDIRRVFQAAQSYVMLSRVQSLEQLFILEKLPADKLYVDMKALGEVQRLEEISINNNPSPWDKEDKTVTKIVFFNSRSIKNKFRMIETDENLKKADAILLSETWLDEGTDSFILPDYNQSFSGGGNGGGTAAFYKDEFKIETQIEEERVNITKMSRKNLDIITIYRSSNGKMETLLKNIKSLLNMNKMIIVGGDLNICFFKHEHNPFTLFLRSKGFSQKVLKSTHIEGGLLDHVYVYQPVHSRQMTVLHFPKYYSDHDAIGIIIKE